MTRLLLGLAIVGGLLFVTNPSRPEFNAFVQTYIANKITEEARKRGDENPDGMGQFGGAIAGFVMPALPIEQRNFLVFSIYDLRLSQSDAGKKCSFIGIVKQFLPLGECKLD